MMNPSSSINPREIEQFNALAARWWDEKGPFRPLHRLNPARMRYIREQITRAGKDLEDIAVLDIGCGGGLVCEPLARLGAGVTGIDAGIDNIKAAKAHAGAQGLNIDYQATTAEEFLEKGQRFDVVLALEILEHVEQPADFVRNCIQLLKPGGVVIFSTLNRTKKSFVLGIVAAEYILRWVPAGTHNWKNFIKPSELGYWVREAGVEISDIKGLVFDPFKQEFHLSDKDVAVNYFLSARKI